MARIAAFVKRYLIPGSVAFLAIAVAVAVVLFQFRGVAIVVGRVWLLTIVLLYWILSLPAVSTVLLRRIGSGYRPVSDRDSARGAERIVVLGNGSVTYRDADLAVSHLTRRTVYCVFEAVHLFRLLDPAQVIVSGGPSSDDPSAQPESVLMRDLLTRFGVPADRIVVEGGARTTEQQAANVAGLLPNPSDRPVLLVTTPAHIRRAADLFRARGIAVVPAVTSELRYDDGRRGWRRWMPSAIALRGSESAMYEWLAAGYVAITRSRAARAANARPPTPRHLAS